MGFETGGLGTIPGSPTFAGVPSISLNQLGITSGLLVSFTREPNHVFQAAESYSRISGSHTLRFGADIRFAQFNIRQNIEQKTGSTTHPDRSAQLPTIGPISAQFRWLR